jgi:hypothetical protein
MAAVLDVERMQAILIGQAVQLGVGRIVDLMPFHG